MKLPIAALAAAALCSAVAARRPHKDTRAHDAFRTRAEARVGLLSANLSSIVSVLDFGANGNNQTDNTAAFQAALNSLNATGGIVYAPAGYYIFSGSLNVPPAVSLVGTAQTVPSHDFRQHDRLDGTVLMPRGGRGDASGTPFITLNRDTTLKGVTIFYPDQDPSQTPQPYPWAISMVADNSAVTDTELLNPFLGINATRAHRHYIARVQGQPLSIGVFVDQTYDIGRVEDVHWNPWWNDSPAVINYTNTQGRGFVFARTDWEYTLNTFVFAMAVGYDFIESPEGSCNGNFVGIGADCCANASVRVQSSDPWGISIVNGEFTSFSGSFGPDIADHSQVLVTQSNTGAVQFVNSAFWGPSNQIASISGSGSVSFDSCLFNHWDAVKANRSAIHLFSGDLQVRGSNFQYPSSPSSPRVHVQLEAGAGKAIVTDNLVKGPLVVLDGGAKRTIVANNADDGW